MKRFTFSKAVIATALVGACSSAFAADTAEIIVKGQVVPAACSIDITGGGVFDYGIMTKAQIEALNGVDAQTTQTRLDEKVQTFAIDCGNTDTSVAWRVHETLYDTASSNIPGFTILGQLISGARRHGLGAVDVNGTAVPIGQYGAVVDDASVKLNVGGQTNVQGMTTVSSNDGTLWVNGNGGKVIHGNGWDLQSFRRVASAGNLPPQPFAHVTGDIHVQAAVNRLDVLPDAFSFNGLTTLTLVYLGADNKPLP